MNVVALTIVHDRILHEGAKRCEGTSTLYTMGCQGSLRAARPESVTRLLLRVIIGVTNYSSSFTAIYLYIKSKSAKI